MTHSTFLTLELARFACKLTPDAIPARWKRKIILHFIDSLGCGVAARNDQVLQMSAKLARSQYAAGSSITLDGGSQLSSSGAAFLNAVAINALDYDDGFEVAGRGMGHPGATLVAGALAAIGSQPVSGEALLTALVAAWEINGRVILSQQPSPERFREVYGVCQHESLGAAVAFGLLRGCDASALENCLGLAASLTPLPSLHKYNWQQRPLVSFKDYNAPAAEAGVRAVEMHLSGIVGPRDVLAGEQGFWRMMGSDMFRPEILTDNLGSSWLLQHASFKAYPTCRWMHTALESFEGALKALTAPEKILRVRVYGSQLLADFFTDTRPESGTDAQFSLPLAIACLAFNIPRHLWSSEKVRTSTRLLEFADKVEVLAETRFDQLMREFRRPAARVEVVTEDAVVTGDTIDFPLGSQENPLSEQKIIDKFIANLSSRLPTEKAEGIAARLLDLERGEDIGALLAPMLE
ncbi:MmgE/PrpD family protein [Pantoea cypripedii]|uniref:Immunity protein n=1 Tax=Pantoea cypripedii TaxID=55209 RepID=A0A1X1EKW9_PANCY|nr:MmgE/PrpD family protein [Pantoea cypripedii]MBP2198768.1 2-methylcitrate dehydratase PrpD [Pantoea cypripedii]ORM89549.1 immunity protein [Pantoea cypripedii]